MWRLVSQSHPAVFQTQSLAQLAYQWLAEKCYGRLVLSPDSNWGRGNCEPGGPALWVSLSVRAASNKHRKQDHSTAPGWRRDLASHGVRLRELFGFLLDKQFTKCENKKNEATLTFNFFGIWKQTRKDLTKILLLSFCEYLPFTESIYAYHLGSCPRHSPGRGIAKDDDCSHFIKSMENMLQELRRYLCLKQGADFVCHMQKPGHFVHKHTAFAFSTGRLTRSPRLLSHSITPHDLHRKGCREHSSCVTGVSLV